MNYKKLLKMPQNKALKYAIRMLIILASLTLLSALESLFGTDFLCEAKKIILQTLEIL